MCLFSVFFIPQFNLVKYCRYLAFKIKFSKILVEQLSMSTVSEQNDRLFLSPHSCCVSSFLYQCVVVLVGLVVSCV
jgi:hypothetical protein